MGEVILQLRYPEKYWFGGQKTCGLTEMEAEMPGFILSLMAQEQKQSLWVIHDGSQRTGDSAEVNITLAKWMCILSKWIFAPLRTSVRGWLMVKDSELWNLGHDFFHHIGMNGDLVKITEPLRASDLSPKI